jgi:hypothetical protein
MLSYGALNEAMEALAARTCLVAKRIPTDDKPPLIVIVDQSSLSNLAAYDAFDRTARFLTSTYKSMIPPASSFANLQKAASSTDSTVTVGSAAAISVNDTLQIDQEQMLVTGETGNTLNVQRGQNATSSANHANFAQVVDLTTINAPPTPVVTPAAAGAGGDVFSDITNAVAAVLIAGNSESASSITIQDSSAAVTLFSHLSSDKTCTAANVQVVYPGIYGTSTDLTNFNKTLDNVINARQAALVGLAAIQPVQTGQNAPAPMKLTAFNTFDGAFTQFFQSWFTANGTTGLSALTPIVQGYSLRNQLLVPVNAAVTGYQRQLFVVFVNVAAAGATLQDRKNALSALTTGDWIRYSGGVIVNATILGEPGSNHPLYTGVLRYRSPLTHIKNPRDKNATHYGDNLEMCPLCSDAIGSAKSRMKHWPERPLQSRYRSLT